MPPIPRYRTYAGPALFAAGFRPFFLGGALWAAVAVPLWLAMLRGLPAPGGWPPSVWHAHEMLFGYGAAIVAGFLLTAIPNWTGRMPLQGAPLAGLAALWLAGRLGVLLSFWLGPAVTAAVDLAFPVAFLAVIAREIIAGRNWRNAPMLVAIAALLAGNALIHLEALGLLPSAAAGERVGVATLAMLIGLIGGRVVPSFTRNWLVKTAPGTALPAGFGHLDRAALGGMLLALAAFVVVPESRLTALAELAAGVLVLLRLALWRGAATAPEPLLGVLHLGYFWLGSGLMLLGANGMVTLVPGSTALHALTVGAIGTMTLAMMTRATLGHSGRALTATRSTSAMFALVSLAALLRLAAPFAGTLYPHGLDLAGLAWSAAFVLFVVLHAGALTRRRGA